MAVIHLNIDDETLEILEETAARKDISVSEFIRRVLHERLEDEEDILSANDAYLDYLKNPSETISFEEAKKRWLA